MCLDCNILFEIGTDRAIDAHGMICVDCASPNLNLQKSDSEVESRLQNLVLAVGELVVRVENIEECLRDEPGPDDTSRKNKKKAAH